MTALPPGRTCGSLRAYSSSRRSTTCSGVPPLAATRQSLGPTPNTITSPSPQLAPVMRGVPSPGTLAMVVYVVDPDMGTLRNSPASQYPIHAPSGEKNGESAPVVVGMGVAIR